MQRRGESEQPVKGRRHRAIRPKARKAPTARVSNTDLQEQIAALTRELKEGREQQTATSEVLKVISNSPGKLEAVFQAMLETAARVCQAKFGTVFLLEDGAIRPIASLSVPEPLIEFFQRGPHRPHKDAPIMRAARTKQPAHVVDFAAERPYIERNPMAVAAVELGGVRTLLAVPLLKQSELIGVFAIFRQEVRPFTDKQIELVTTFADQAVIAIENARLFDEVQVRTRELSESLEQQTATSEVLKAISSSPGELEPVFNAMLENATRICEAKFGLLYRSEGDVFRTVAIHGAPQSYVEERQRDPIVRPAPATALGRAVATKRPVQIADILAGPEYLNVPAGYTGREFARLSGGTNGPAASGGELLMLSPWEVKEDQLRPLAFQYAIRAPEAP